MSCLPSRLYAIADPAQTGGRPLASVIDAMLAGGVTVLQLRVKDRPADEFLRLALAARERTSRQGCLFIVNDRVDIALAARADGVHLGQEDLPLEAARPLVGDKLIGVSTHSPEQAEEAERGGADYVGFGPMFPTPHQGDGLRVPRPLDARVRKAPGTHPHRRHRRRHRGQRGADVEPGSGRRGHDQPPDPR